MTLASLLGLGAALLTLGGTGLLHTSWRSVLPDNRGLLVLSGWLMLLLALVLWIEATGPEFGTVIGLCVPALAAWLLTGSTAETRAARQRRASRDSSSDNSEPDSEGSAWRRHLLLFVLTVPLAALAASFLTIALAELLPWSELNRTALVGFVMPPLWGLLAWWLCATQQLLRAAGLLLAATAAAALYLFVLL